MPQVVLDGAGVGAVTVDQLVAAGVAQHVGVDAHRKAGGLAGATDHVLDSTGAQRPTDLGHEQEGTRGAFASQASQGAQLVALDGLHAALAALQTPHIDFSAVEVHIVPPDIDELGDAESMAVGDQDQGRVAVRIAARVLDRPPQRLDLGLGEVADGRSARSILAYGERARPAPAGVMPKVVEWLAKGG